MTAAPRSVRLAAVVVVAGLMGCGGDGDGRPEAAPFGSPGAPRTPAELCTAVLDEREADVVQPGLDRMLDVLLWSRAPDPPSADELADAGEAMETTRDALVADRERLADAEVAADDVAAWGDVLGTLDDRIAVLEERIAVVGADDVMAAAADLGPDGGATTDAGAALEQLGLTGRDCEVIASYPGAPTESADFVAEAASACAAIVTRRRDGGLRDDLDIVLEGVVAVYEGEPVEVDDEITEALDRVIDEWEQTRDDLADIDADDAPDPDGWAQVVGLAEDRVDGYGRRAAALDDGDQAEIAEAFDPAVLGEPGFEGFEPNGLGQRDCRSVEP